MWLAAIRIVTMAFLNWVYVEASFFDYISPSFLQHRQWQLAWTECPWPVHCTLTKSFFTIHEGKKHENIQRAQFVERIKSQINISTAKLRTPVLQTHGTGHTFPSLWRLWQYVWKILTGKLQTDISPNFFLDIYSLVYSPTENPRHRD